MGEPIKRTQASDNLAWLDLEMTGLDAQNDAIIQAALIVTNAALEPLEEIAIDVWQPPEVVGRMVPYVHDMHEKNGLLQRVQRSKTDLAAAERMLMDRIVGWCGYPAVLCGNTIGQDKRFIERWMPGLSGYLSYRSIDVTSIKLLARLWYGEKAVYEKPTAGEHDALVDIKNSIDELRHYRATLFRAP